MSISNSTSSVTQRQSEATLVSHYELILFCCAAFLLAVAYPTKQTLSPQATPVVMPMMNDTSIELEAMNTTVESDPASTTLLVEQINSELITEIPAVDPAS